MENNLSINNDLSTRKWGWLVLFTAMPTLICCALPIVLVSLGFGSVVAAVFANIGPLAFLAGNKFWVFVLSGGLIAVSAYMIFIRPSSCPADRELASKCQSAKVWNRRLLLVSGAIWSIGFFSSYMLAPILEFWG